MSRKRQNQIIDEIIHSITLVSENQSSLSVKDRNILAESIDELNRLKKKKGKTYKEIENTISFVCSKLLKFFK
ncbi:MAG: hypothetical protein ACK5UE_10110 [Chitinophagales bacterium]|jgi:hypothetical protein|nr:hypothetical protein [Sphingobacteriales bacterium]